MTEKALLNTPFLVLRLFSSPSAGSLFAGPLADLHVAHVAAVDRKAHGRADLVESELPGGPGIDCQQVVDGIVDDLEDVGMPGDEEFQVHGLDFLYGARIVMAGITPDVGHQHLHPFAFESQECGVDAAGHAAVDIAAHGTQRLESSNPVGEFDRADVARMPDFVHVFQKSRGACRRRFRGCRR